MTSDFMKAEVSPSGQLSGNLIAHRPSQPCEPPNAKPPDVVRNQRQSVLRATDKN